MKKFKNKNFRISIIEIVGLVLFAALIVLSSYFGKQLSDTKGLLNIGKTNVDFIIKAPNVDQIDEISELAHVDSVVPYVYRTTKCSADKKTVNVTLFLIDNAADVSKTTFSDKLLISGNSIKEDNQVCISNELAKNAGIGIGDKVAVDIDGNNVALVVCGIYGSDYRYVGGSMLTTIAGDVKKALQSYKYSGAYIDSNDLAASKNYFDNEYVPMGDLRPREDFDSDEAYEIYLSTRNQSDTTKETFDTSEFMKDVSKRNNAKIIRYTVISIALLVVAIIMAVLIVKLRATSYTKKNVLRDIKDNYTIEQELSMYGRYFNGYTALILMMLVINVVVSKLIWLEPVLSVNNIAGILGAMILMLVVSGTEKSVLKKKFAEERNKQKNE